MRTKKGIQELFAKIQKENPGYGDYLVLHVLSSQKRLSRVEKEQAFLDLVDPFDYLLEEEDFALTDRAFRKTYPTAKAHNDEVIHDLIEQLENGPECGPVAEENSSNEGSKS